MGIRDKLISAGVALLLLARHSRTAIADWLERITQASHPAILRPATDRARGDVPGWVLITLMSAILVAGLLAIAGPAFERLFTEAMEQVKNP